jgi:hypothetical protein
LKWLDDFKGLARGEAKVSPVSGSFRARRLSPIPFVP